MFRNISYFPSLKTVGLIENIIAYKGEFKIQKSIRDSKVLTSGYYKRVEGFCKTKGKTHRKLAYPCLPVC